MNILQIKNLAIRFGAQYAVRYLDLDLPEGEVTALVGESGCGKTMTALAIGRILPEAAHITADQIRFKEQDLLALSESEMRDHRGASFAYIFQEPMTSLNPVLRIGDQLTEVLTAHGQNNKQKNRARAIALLDRVKFTDPERIYSSYPHQLSGGMRQRVMIAMALMLEPELLIADEPTTALDVTVQKEILLLLHELRQQYGITILLITHDLDLVGAFADHTKVMYAGQIVEQGTGRSVLDAPAHPYSQGLLLSTPAYQNRGNDLHFIPGIVKPTEEDSVGCAFVARCPVARERCVSETPVPDQSFVGKPLCHYPLSGLQPELWRKNHA